MIGMRHGVLVSDALWHLARHEDNTLPSRIPARAAPLMSSTPLPPPAAPEEQPRQTDCAEQLRQHFPALFGGGFKPLKLHIQADIQQRAPGVFTKQALTGFLRRHTGSTGYLIALTRSPHRYDL